MPLNMASVAAMTSSQVSQPTSVVAECDLPTSKPDIDSSDEETAPRTATEASVPFADLSHFQQLCCIAAYDKYSMFQDESLVRREDHRHGLWWATHDVLVVPDAEALRQDLLCEMHDSPHSGHKGVKKPRKAGERFHTWPSLRRIIAVTAAVQ